MDSITESNKLIAKFEGHQVNFGYKRVGILIHGQHVSIDKLLYHESWNWLMPVIEKIEELNYVVKISTSMVDISGQYCKVKKVVTNSKITAVYEAVIEFIKYYNE